MRGWLAGVNWSQARLRLMLTVTIAVALVISFSSIKNLAEHAGFGWRSWLYPLLVDVVAAAGYEVWMARSAARRWAVSLALFAVACSTVANVSDWLITQGTLLAAVLGALPPLSLAWLLMVVHRHRAAAEPGVGAPADGARPAPVLSSGWVAEQTEPNQALVHQAPHRGGQDVVEPGKPVPAGGPTASPAPVNQELVRDGEDGLVRELRKAPDLLTMTRRTAERLLSELSGEKVGSTRAQRLLEAARNGSSS